MIRDPEYDAWLRSVPADITDDTLWRMTAYRYALYAMSRAQADVPYFARCRETRPHIDQLLRAVGAISANLEEGYGRSGGPDRAHFYEYAESSAREARGWYYKCARALPAETLAARMAVFTQIIRMLTVVVPDVRDSKIRWRARREKPDVESPPDHASNQLPVPVRSNQWGLSSRLGFDTGSGSVPPLHFCGKSWPLAGPCDDSD